MNKKRKEANIMKSVLLRLRETQSSLSAASKSVSNYILNNAQEASHITIREMAEKSFTSASSVVRLCKSIGFDGYKAMQLALVVELSSLNQNTPDTQLMMTKDDSISMMVSKITYQNIKALEQTQYLINEETLDRAADLIINKKRILLFGMGSSQVVAKDFYLKLLRLNKNVIINEDVHSQLVQAKNSNSDDVVIMYSYSGETKEIIEFLGYCLANNATIISITRYTKSTLSKNATYSLYTSAAEPLFRNGAMGSRISQLTINDILHTLIINKEYDESMKKMAMTYIEKG